MAALGAELQSGGQAAVFSPRCQHFPFDIQYLFLFLSEPLLNLTGRVSQLVTWLYLLIPENTLKTARRSHDDSLRDAPCWLLSILLPI